MLLSIIVPTYNSAKYIKQLLVSFSSQEFPNAELLLIDSVSTDETIASIQEYQRNNIVVYSEKDNGIYDAMNKGIALAKGEWIYFMGSDDRFYDEHVLSEVSKQLTGDIDLVYGDVLWVPDEIMEKGICSPGNLIHRNINHQRIFYRKKLFQQYGGYNLQYRIASDHELNIRFFCNTAIRKKYVPFTIANYHSGGFSANKVDEVFWANWKQIFKENFSKQLSNKVMYEKLGWYCRNLIARHEYRSALPVFLDVFIHSFSPGFVLLSFKQLIGNYRKYAG